MSDGFSILAERFRQKFFGRKVGAGFSRLQLVFLRKRFQILLQIFFIISSFWVMFFLTSDGKFPAGLLKLHFFSSETLVELIDFENIKHVSKTSDSDRKFLYLWRAFSRSVE